MREKRKFLLIIIVFILLSFFLNFFVLRNIFNSLSANKGVLFYLLLLLLSLSYPSTAILERYKSTPLTKLFYEFSSIWIGIAFFAIVIFLLYELVNIFFVINEVVASIVILSLIVIVSAVALINGKRLRVHLVDIEIKGLKKEMKIVHLSDLHIGAIHHKEFFERVVKETNALKPDVVVITGDLVDGSTVITDEIISPINEIKSPVYFVIGNHEGYEGLRRVMPILKNTKMKILRNEKSKFNDITFIGVDYSESRREVHDRLNRIEIDRNKTNILLYHSPIFKAHYLEKKKIDLHLAGHTHNGQLFPLNLLAKLVFPYVRGLHQWRNSSVFVSTGTGTWGPPMRLGSTNEIDLITLKKKK